MIQLSPPLRCFCCGAPPYTALYRLLQSVAGASVANLVLDCIAVFGLGMGIKGAALSTTVAQWVGLLYLVKEVRRAETKTKRLVFVLLAVVLRILYLSTYLTQKYQHLFAVHVSKMRC